MSLSSFARWWDQVCWRRQRYTCTCTCQSLNFVWFHRPTFDRWGLSQKQICPNLEYLLHCRGSPSSVTRIHHGKVRLKNLINPRKSLKQFPKNLVFYSPVTQEQRTCGLLHVSCQISRSSAHCYGWNRWTDRVPFGTLGCIVLGPIHKLTAVKEPCTVLDGVQFAHKAFLRRVCNV